MAVDAHNKGVDAQNGVLKGLYSVHQQRSQIRITLMRSRIRIRVKAKIIRIKGKRIRNPVSSHMKDVEAFFFLVVRYGNLLVPAWTVLECRL